MYTRPRLANLELLIIMSSLSRIPTEDFDRQVSAVAMNDRFILICKTDGVLAAVYSKNGVKAFSMKVTDSEITAVCCEEQAEYSSSIFYAGDSEGNLFTVNQKGKMVAKVQLNGKKGVIHTNQVCHLRLHNHKQHYLLVCYNRLQERTFLNCQCQLLF